MTRNILLTIEYDGSRYFGWQVQPRVPTIQGEIQKTVRRVLKQDIKLKGSGRTDAGVHAYGQTASFEIIHGIPVEKIPRVLNNKLPGDIKILAAKEVPEDFHARFSAVGKKYIYKMRESVDVFANNYFYEVPKKLDYEVMKEAAKNIVGTHDFKCFQASGGEEKETTVRTIFDLDVKKTEEGYELVVCGNGFLYNMVRIITGTIVDVGLGKIFPEEIKGIVDSKDRSKAGHTAPPQGLYLAEVYYTEDIE